jgi:hypothetical protein
MLNANQISSLKAKYPEPEKLVQAVNVGSHNEAIKQANAVVSEHAVDGKIDAARATDELLQLLLPQVTEEITLADDPFYEWMSVADWVRKNGSRNPADMGWMLEDDKLYRPRSTNRPV